MRVPSRLVLSAAVACGAALGAAAPGLAADEGVLDTADDAACDLTNGAVSAVVGDCVADPQPSNADEQTTRPSGNQGDPESSDRPQQSSDTASDVVVAADSDDTSAPSSASGGSDIGTVDRDNGEAPKGGIETGAGGTADGSGALPASLAGGVIVAAGGMVFAQRRHGRHARQSRHSL